MTSACVDERLVQVEQGYFSVGVAGPEDAK